jgi:acyl carrier protein
MVETAVFEVIANHINRQTDVITLDSELKDLGVDSLGAITIL